MKSLTFPSVLDAHVAEVEGEKTGKWPVPVLLSFFFLSGLAFSLLLYLPKGTQQRMIPTATLPFCKTLPLMQYPNYYGK